MGNVQDELHTAARRLTAALALGFLAHGCSSPPATGKPIARISPFQGISIIDGSSVELAARCCLDAGWLEQVACSPDSREHETLVVVPARPTEIHAAMLLAGFEPGRPGYWRSTPGGYEAVEPVGDKLEVLMRYTKDGRTIEEPVHRWIRDHHTGELFPHEPFVFAGSRFEPNGPDDPDGEHYVADYSGSVIGLVTFGDEVIGLGRVIADDTSVQPAEWEVNEDAVPAIGTPVTVVILPWE